MQGTAERYGSTHHLANQPPACSDIREGTVAAEIRDLHAQLQALDDVTGKLRQILEPLIVNRPRPGTNEATGPCNPIDRCKVSGEIRAAVDLACNITAKCNDMLCSLDL